MVENRLTANAMHLEAELEWLSQIIAIRVQSLDRKGPAASGYILPTPPVFTPPESKYSGFIAHYQLTMEERLCLILSLVPHIRPQILDFFFSNNELYNRGFTQFGGLRGQLHGGFLPTGETFLFIAAADNLAKRFSLLELFDAGHFFVKHQVLHLEPAPDGEPVQSGALVLSHDLVDYFTTGTARKPDLSAQFPAKRISTQMEWSDLVLNPATLEQLEEIKTWLSHGSVLMHDWGMKKQLRKGYRSLFHGPPGTGKSLTACLLGKYTNRDVYRIDLSLVVSKYIGETEKNLSRVFAQAENKNWILFFDEADALFGKRTEISDAHDRYANQEVSYLLQRIEDHDGIIILASNFKSNLDDSFTRRFESIIFFPMPKPDERLLLWKNGFSVKSHPGTDVILEVIASDHELSGGAIMNVIRYASLMALKRDSDVIRNEDIRDGIRKEYQKEGRTL